MKVLPGNLKIFRDINLMIHLAGVEIMYRPNNSQCIVNNNEIDKLCHTVIKQITYSGFGGL